MYPPPPSTGYVPQPSIKPSRPTIQLTVSLPSHAIPASPMPVSPMLAAPPRPHFSPLSPPSPLLGVGYARPDSPNESIRGFDAMREKRALFREGEEELVNPFSPRLLGPRPRYQRPYSRADFWKRFSVSVRLDEVAQRDSESGWLAERRKSVWKKPVFVIPLIITLIVIGGIIAFLVVHITGESSDTD